MEIGRTGIWNLRKTATWIDLLVGFNEFIKLKILTKVTGIVKSVLNMKDERGLFSLLFILCVVIDWNARF